MYKILMTTGATVEGTWREAGELVRVRSPSEAAQMVKRRKAEPNDAHTAESVAETLAAWKQAKAA
jgi:hypothetical protein